LPDTGYKAKTKKDDEAVQKVRRQIIGGRVELRERKQISIKDFTRLPINHEITHQLVQSDHALDAVIASYITAIFDSAPQVLVDPVSTDNLDEVVEGWIDSRKH